MHQHGAAIQCPQLMEPKNFLLGACIGTFSQVNHERRAGRGGLETSPNVFGERQRMRPTVLFDHAHREILVERGVTGIVMAHRGDSCREVA
jgi:hypothetical protein